MDEGTPLGAVADSLEWGVPKGAKDGVVPASATFRSPFAAELPEEAKAARFVFVSPAGLAVKPWEEGGPVSKPPGVCIIMPATGEQGASTRMVIAKKLAREHGVASIIPIAPYYGYRRPSHQPGHYVSDVASLLLQSTAIIAEAAMLRLWVSATFGAAVPTVVTGFSWGGSMTAGTVDLCCNWEPSTARSLGAVTYAGSSTAACLMDAALNADIDYPALGGVDAATMATTTARLQEVLLLGHVRRFAPPKGVSLGAVEAVAMKSDGFVRTKFALELLQHFEAHASPGVVESVWHDGGHVVAFLRRTSHQYDAIVRVLRRLPAAV